MNKLKKELCERMPYLIPRNVWTDKIAEDYDYDYIRGEYELPRGWQKLFLQMCEDIRQPLIDDNYLNEFRFTQVKEKYNTMRCYNNGAPQTVHDIINKYEHLSCYVCQECGQPATIETTGYIASYCDKCGKDETHFEKIEFDPIMRYTRYDKNGTTKFEVNCSDEWERLYK